MIAWREVGQGIQENIKREWRRYKCTAAISSDGTCHGYSDSFNDDEPCYICKACDRLAYGRESGWSRMTMLEALKVIDRWQKLKVIDDSYETQCLYEGDSEDMPAKLNNFEVITMYVEDNVLVIEVCE